MGRFKDAVASFYTKIVTDTLPRLSTVRQVHRHGDSQISQGTIKVQRLKDKNVSASHSKNCVISGLTKVS